ncbi:MAG TPA: response regulator transcription factor [Desulfotomaculum sp.]|nr:response regulator transcription factor [Desulfotomaculum sp.]
MALILVVDDEEHIQRLLGFTLEREGFEVRTAGDGLTALKLAENNRPDLIILDVMLPGMDGLQFCKALRANERSRDIPVIMLSARGAEKDKIWGLETGADDYVTKPFSARELVARVRAHLRRRPPGQEKNRLVYGQLTIDRERLTVYWNDARQELTPKEFELLYLLAAYPGRVFSREYLLDKIWGYDFPGGSRTVDVHIRYIRQKLEQLPGAPRFIQTVRGAGYRFREQGE